MKRHVTALLLAGSLATATTAMPTAADARWGWGAGAVGAGLLFGAALARPAYAYGNYPGYSYGYTYPSYSYPSYSYGYGYPASYGYPYRPYYRSAYYGYGGYRGYYRPALYGGYRTARRVAIHRARWH